MHAPIALSVAVKLGKALSACGSHPCEEEDRSSHQCLCTMYVRCKLFDSLVLPILSYASEVWAVDDKIGDAAELLHK